VYFTPGFGVVSYCNNILTAFYNCSIIVKKLHRLVWFLKEMWLNKPPEDDPEVLKHVGVAIL
jgi:hypothetical protein